MTTEIEGTGIGVAIARQSMESMGGRIDKERAGPMVQDSLAGSAPDAVNRPSRRNIGRAMNGFSAFTSALHALAAVVWVGGMFFAYMVLRPAMAAVEPPQRLALWSRVLQGFLPWVWIAVIVLPATGYAAIVVDFGGFANAGLHIHLMHGVGLVMIGLFLYLFFVPYRSLRHAVAAEDWPGAASSLAVVRRIVATNLALGVITVALGASGRLWT